MSKYRSNLPQLSGRLFLTDSGLETTLVFHEGIDLPFFAAWKLMQTSEGRITLRRYFDRHIDIARKQAMGFILDTPTWRASADWARRMDVPDDELARINQMSVSLLEEIRDEHETAAMPMVINGVIGPRGDGYHPDSIMSAAEAQEYHATQIRTFANSAADMVSAITMTNASEAIGITQAARQAGIPVVVSFTVETNGALPTGQALADAISETDAATASGPAYYMVNCAHPTHFQDKLEAGSDWMSRVHGIRANASKRSHAELDEATDLDDGNPVELGHDYAAIQRGHPHVTVFGGCCGTDHRHIEQISGAVRHAA